MKIEEYEWQEVDYQRKIMVENKIYKSQLEEYCRVLNEAECELSRLIVDMNANNEERGRERERERVKDIRWRTMR